MIVYQKFVGRKMSTFRNGVCKSRKKNGKKKHVLFQNKNRFCDGGGVKVDWNLFIFRPLYFMLN